MIITEQYSLVISEIYYSGLGYIDGGGYGHGVENGNGDGDPLDGTGFGYGANPPEVQNRQIEIKKIFKIDK